MLEVRIRQRIERALRASVKFVPGCAVTISPRTLQTKQEKKNKTKKLENDTNERKKVKMKP
jgi:hypothetical protein